jgi:hypothetical protein
MPLVPQVRILPGAMRSPLTDAEATLSCVADFDYRPKPGFTIDWVLRVSGYDGNEIPKNYRYLYLSQIESDIEDMTRDYEDKTGASITRVRPGLDLGHQHVPRRGRIRVVDPIERDHVPTDFGQFELGGGVHRLVGQPTGSAVQLRGVPSRRGDGVVGLGQLAGDVLGRDGRHVGVFPGVVAHLHARIDDALGAGRVNRDFVADLKNVALAL